MNPNIKIVSFIFLIFAALMIIQCGPPKKIEPERPTFIKEPPRPEECTPQNLTVRPGDRKLSLKWETDCPDSVLISGYNIYLLRKPLHKDDYGSDIPGSLKPYNDAPYPGDTDSNGKFESIDVERLINALEYFITVRTVFPDGRVSPASNEVSAICRPEGEFTLAYRYSDLNDGFSFAKGKPARADASDNDLYFYDKDGFDFIASPHRINGFLRTSAIYSLGKTSDIHQYPKLVIDFPSAEKMPVLVGESYVIKTADNNFAKLRIEDATGEGQDRKLKIKYIYQTAKDLARF